MPELPEVETVKRGLEPHLVDRTLLSVEQRRPNLRFPFPDGFADRLANRRVTHLGRRAKYLLVHLDDGTVLLMHLGMSGSFRVEEGGAADVPGDFHHARSKNPVHDHVVFHLDSGTRVIYNDPRRFGYMSLIAGDDFDADPLIRGLGIEPVGNALSGPFLAERFAGRAAPLKAALLDQGVIAGLGNIYVCEALWRARLSPRRAAGSIVRRGGGATDRTERLAHAITAVIAEAIVAGGSSLRDYVQADGSMGYFQHTFAVYDREHAPCPREGCRGTVKRIVQSGRSTFFCPECQR